MIEKVLTSGDVRNTKVTEEELIQAAREEIDSLRKGDSLIFDIYQNGNISYTPESNSQYINILADVKEVSPLLYGNKNRVLAAAGKKAESRFSIFGSNPLSFFGNGKNLNYEPYMKRVFAWLLAGEPVDTHILKKNQNIVLSYTTNTSAIKSWIEDNYPKWNIKRCNDNNTLESCYAGADLIILGHSGNDHDAQAIQTLLPKVVTQATPVLYLHDSWGTNSLADTIASFFGIAFPYAGNYWDNDAASWQNVSLMQRSFFENFGYESIDTMLHHFQDQDYNFDWGKCKKSDGTMDENGDECSAVVGLKSQFHDGASKVKNLMSLLDRQKKDIFKTRNYRLQKLLALLGDKFRQDIVFPMDKVTTDDTTFMKSYYADHAVYNYRTINPVQPDMGNFSRSDFSDITPTTKTVHMTTKNPFRAAGVYVLPNKTVKITRLDDNHSVATKVFINSLRSGATHQYQKNGYKRPKYLQSTHIEVKPHESIYMTSPYGGPLEIAFNKNGAKVSFKIENIGVHPVWSEFDTNPDKDGDFMAALDADKYDWAEIVTSAFEVHSTRDKMLDSIHNFRWGSASALAEATKTYASSNPMSLAGYKGPGIEAVADIVNYTTHKGIPIYNADFVKHMNADQAACGSGCSGNPYDAYWAFDPIAHGDIHEVGHSLERALFRLKGWELHSSTNYYAYYTQMRYNQYVEANGLEEKYYKTNSHIPKHVFKKQYETLQSCVNATNTTSCMQTYWDSSNYSSQSLFNIEAMMYAQKYAEGDYALTNGFHLLGRLHILERYLAKDAKKDWENAKDKLGFENYSIDEINAIDANDWLLVSLSWATGLDYRPFFDMYGQPYSDKASTQVEDYGYKAVKKVFFAEDIDSGFILPSNTAGDYLNKTEVPVDGHTSYPY